MINKIGVENFRVFKNYTEFELRPLTLLTGPNNAGKSSLTKLLLLLNNGFQQLNFKKGKHNLEDFDKILNWENDSQELLIKIDYQNDLLNEDFYYEFKYINSDLRSISIKNNEVTLLTFIPYLKQETVDYLKKEDEVGFDFDFEEEYDPIVEQYQNFTLSFNINYVIDLFNNYNIKFYNNFHGDFINKYRNKDLENDRFKP